MKKTFPGYYVPTKDEFKKLWDDCIFVFDANVLLNLYRYSPETSKNYLQLLKKIKNRIWIPYQAAFEFQNRRLDVIFDQENAYRKITSILENNLNNTENDLNSYLKHSTIRVNEYLQQIKKTNTKILNDIAKKQKTHPKFTDVDDIRDEITNIFENRVGIPYEKAELDKLMKIAKERCIKKIPPGYKDFKEQSADNTFGDVIIWFEIINKAKEEEKPILFITDDRKEDWWYKFNGKTLSPRPELINEIKLDAKVDFYMYQSDPFMEYSNKYLKQKIEAKAIQEVKKVREDDERNIKAYNNRLKHELNLGFSNSLLENILKEQQKLNLGLPGSIAFENLFKQQQKLNWGFPNDILDDALKQQQKLNLGLPDSSAFENLIKQQQKLNWGFPNGILDDILKQQQKLSLGLPSKNEDDNTLAKFKNYDAKIDELSSKLDKIKKYDERINEVTSKMDRIQEYDAKFKEANSKADKSKK